MPHLVRASREIKLGDALDFLMSLWDQVVGVCMTGLGTWLPEKEGSERKGGGDTKRSIEGGKLLNKIAIFGGDRGFG